MEEHPSVTLFREYLRIKTVQPNPDYVGAESFLKSVASRYGLKFFSHECVEGKPHVNLSFLAATLCLQLPIFDIVILTWEGSDASLPSILLNSHIDVVPVDESKWNTDPFGAHKDEQGNIYARGAQDMKCVGIQHVEAVYRLKQSGFQPKRTIHISFVPDEEIGGKDGMEKFVETQHFKDLNVGFAMDEGLANPHENCIAYYGERAAWWVVAETSGVTGHGSQLFQGTAVDKLLKFLQKYTDWRQRESEKLLDASANRKLGDVTTININMIKAGAFSADRNSWQTNIIPSSAKAALDMRIDPSVNLETFEAEMKEWAAKHEVSITILQCMRNNPVTNTNPAENPWWGVFDSVCNDLNVKYEKQVFPAATDSRFIRNKGIPAVGFSPMNHTPVLLHDHNEFLNEKTFLNGIDFFTELVRRLSSMEKHQMD